LRKANINISKIMATFYKRKIAFLLLVSLSVVFCRDLEDAIGKFFANPQLYDLLILANHFGLCLFPGEVLSTDRFNRHWWYELGFSFEDN
jgi:hypothetical protein